MRCAVGKLLVLRACATGRFVQGGPGRRSTQNTQSTQNLFCTNESAGSAVSAFIVVRQCVARSASFWYCAPRLRGRTLRPGRAWTTINAEHTEHAEPFLYK